jgi:hypothetical protein
MKKHEFRYPLGTAEIKISASAFRAGEKALGRPADLEKRSTTAKAPVKNKNEG